MRGIVGKAGFALGLALVIGVAGVQWATAQALGQKAEEFYKNIKVFTGMPANTLVPSMQFMEISLGVHCVYCHDDDNQKRELDVKPTKARARQMIQMVMDINKNTFGGRNVVTCYTCHRGSTKPIVTLAVGGGRQMPGGIAAASRQGGEKAATGQVPTVDQLFDRYQAALGGAENIAKITSRSGKGILTNFAHLDEVHLERPVPTLIPVEFFSKGQDKRMLVTHNANGDALNTFNAGGGWVRAGNAAARDLRPDELDIAKLENAVPYPMLLKQVVNELKVAGTDTIGNYETWVASGRMQTLPVVKLYFDKESGILSSVLYQQPSYYCCHVFRIDFADYTVQNGVRVPMRWTVVGPRESFLAYRMDAVQLNTAVEDSRFAKPAAPAR